MENIFIFAIGFVVGIGTLAAMRWLYLWLVRYFTDMFSFKDLDIYLGKPEEKIF